MTKSYIQQRKAKTSDGMVNQRTYQKVIYSTNENKNKPRKGKSKNMTKSYIKQNRIRNGILMVSRRILPSEGAKCNG